MSHSNFILIGLVVIACMFCQGQNMLGGWTDADVNSKEVKNAADFAEIELNKKSNSMYYMKVTEIVKAQTQVVSGINYFLTLILTSTDCRKNQSKSLEELGSCKVNDKGKELHTTQLCEVTVWDKPWKNETKLSNSDCKPAKERKVKQTKLN